MTTVPSSAAMTEPLDKPRASGSRARMVATAVIRMGRTRVRPPWMSASYVEYPLWRSCSTRSSSTMALVTTMPMSIRKPMRALMPMGWPVMSSAGKAPMVASGRLNRMTSGSTSDPNRNTMTR